MPIDLVDLRVTLVQVVSNTEIVFRAKWTLASIPVLIFADEASESGDTASSTVPTTTTTARKHRDWSAQVDSEQAQQQQELGYNADSTTESATLPRDTGARGGRRGWRRGQSGYDREGMLRNSRVSNLDSAVSFQVTLIVDALMTMKQPCTILTTSTVKFFVWSAYVDVLVFFQKDNNNSTQINTRLSVVTITNGTVILEDTVVMAIIGTTTITIATFPMNTTKRITVLVANRSTSSRITAWIPIMAAHRRTSMEDRKVHAHPNSRAMAWSQFELIECSQPRTSSNDSHTRDSFRFLFVSPVCVNALTSLRFPLSLSFLPLSDGCWLFSCFCTCFYFVCMVSSF